MSNGRSIVFFAIVFFAVCFIHYALFEIRYVWYTQPDDYSFLRRGHAFFLLVVFLLVIFFPSKLLVLVLVPLSLLFPPLFRSAVFPGLDIAMSVGIAIVTVLFFLLMNWRQQLTF